MYSSVDTWEKVCIKLGEDPLLLPIVDHLLEKDRKHSIAYFKAVKIAEAYNLIDKENGNKLYPEWLPYFKKNNKGGYSFRSSDCVNWRSPAYSYAAARLCFISSNGSDHAGQAHEDVYNDLIM